MRRFPPTLGVVGFDFGFKPAFSVAVAGGPSPIRQQDPDDQPLLCTAADTHGLTMASDIVCTTCIPSSVSGASLGGSMKWNARTIAGAFTLTGGLSSPVLGVWTFSLSGPDDVLFSWFSGNAVCAGDPETDISSEPVMQLICSAKKLSFRIFSVTNTAKSGQWHYFFLANNVKFGVPFSNELASCGTATIGLDKFFPTRSVITAGTGGTGTIS